MSDKKYLNLDGIIDTSVKELNPTVSGDKFFIVKDIELGTRIPAGKVIDGYGKHTIYLNFNPHKLEGVSVDDEDVDVLGRSIYESKIKVEADLCQKTKSAINIMQKYINQNMAVGKDDFLAINRGNFYADNIDDGVDLTTSMQKGYAMCIERSAMSQYGLSKLGIESTMFSGSLVFASDGTLSEEEHAFIVIKEKDKVFFYDPMNPIGKDARVLDTGMSSKVFDAFVDEAKAGKSVFICINDKNDGKTLCYGVKGKDFRDVKFSDMLFDFDKETTKVAEKELNKGAILKNHFNRKRS